MDEISDLINQYHLTSTQISSAVIVFSITFSFLLQLVIAWVWKKTHSQLSYSRSFIPTLVIMGILATVILMVIRNNIVGAIALLGALSLIRFRTIVKETRDTAFLFFALVIGVAVGMAHYAVALIATVMISGIVFLLERLQISSLSTVGNFMLIFHAPHDFNMETLRTLLEEHTKTFSLLQARTLDNSTTQYSYSILLRNSEHVGRLLSLIKQDARISHIEVISGERTSHY
jgi:uncharacterized membrane protein YhiD involved in acid resistance